MEDTSIGWDAWAQAVAGKAINVAVDRVMHRPQYGMDPARAYGMDEQGNLYVVGQPSGVVTAQVSNGQQSLFGIPVWMLAAGVVLLVLLERK